MSPEWWMARFAEIRLAEFFRRHLPVMELVAGIGAVLAEDVQRRHVGLDLFPPHLLAIVHRSGRLINFGVVERPFLGQCYSPPADGLPLRWSHVEDE